MRLRVLLEISTWRRSMRAAADPHLLSPHPSLRVPGVGRTGVTAAAQSCQEYPPAVY